MSLLPAALLILALQEPPPDDIDDAFPRPVAPERQWERADAYARRIAQLIAAGNTESVLVWLQRAGTLLPQCYAMVFSYAQQGSYRDVRYGVRLAGREFFSDAQIKDAAASDIHFIGHLAWIRLCAEGFQAGSGEFASLIERLPAAGLHYWAERHHKMIEELRSAGDSPEGILQLARQVGGVGSECPAASFCLLRRIRDRLALEEAGRNRALLWEAGAFVLNRLMDARGAAAWKGRAIDEPDSGDRGAELLLERSNEHFQREDFAAAEKGFRRLLAGWPRNPSLGAALFNLGMTLRKLRRFADARGVLEQLIRSDVNDLDPGGSIMEGFRNYRARAVDEIAACWEEEGRWDLALETYQNLGRAHPTKSFCGTCAQSIGRRRLIKIASAQSMSGRHEESLESFLQGVISSQGPSPQFVVGAAGAALKLGKLEAVIGRLPQRSQALHEMLVYLRALRFRANRDAESLLKLAADRGRADQWGNVREMDEDREPRLALILDVIDLAGSLGPSIIAPFQKKAEEDPSTKMWAMLMIAAVGTDSSRAIVEGDRSDLRPRLLRVADRPMRKRAFELSELEKVPVKRSLDEAIRLASARLGMSPPDNLEVKGPGGAVYAAAAAAVGLGAILLLMFRAWIARSRVAG
jgi:tetratricopeptide (TPR) repeat protein